MTKRSTSADVAGRPATGSGGTGRVDDRGATVCVVGAGASGLAAVRNLRQRGFEVDCYERESGVAGVWNRRHDRSPVYPGTRLITSKPGSGYPDFPVPDDWPDYPGPGHMLAYLEHYADHFGLREHVWFGTEVVRVAAVDEDPDRYDVTVRAQRASAARTLRYAAVVIATGSTWPPKLPRYPGQDEFRGELMHAASYTDPLALRGRRVLVVGAGNSGCDIAAEVAPVAGACWHSSRRGYWYIPKYLEGRPADQVLAGLEERRLPRWVRQRLAERAVRRAVGDLTRFGLPKPDHRILASHPVINSQLLDQIGHGAVTPVPDLVSFGAREVRLADGRVIAPDVVVFATGYLPSPDFVDPTLLGGPGGAAVGRRSRRADRSHRVDRPHRDGAPGGDEGSGAAGPPTREPVGPLRLRWQIFPPQRPTLALVGLIQPEAGLFACVHWQSALVATWLRARASAPGHAVDFWQRYGRVDDRRYHAGRLVTTTRHWYEVNRRAYLRALEQALRELEAIS